MFSRKKEWKSLIKTSTLIFWNYGSNTIIWSQQCTPAAKYNSILGFMNRGRARTSRGGIILFYSTFIRTHLDIAFYFGPQIRERHRQTGVDSGDATGMLGPGALVLWEDVMGLVLVHLGERMASGAPNSIPSTIGRGRRRCSEALHSAAWREVERQQYRLKHETIRLEIGSIFCRIAQDWNGLPRGIVPFLSLDAFKIQLDKLYPTGATSSELRNNPVWTGGWAEDLPKSFLTKIVLSFCNC